jgi:hypothetical protein
MIIKIENVATKSGEKSWWMEDNIQKVSFGHSTTERVLLDDKGDIFINTTFFGDDKDGVVTFQPDVVLIGAEWDKNKKGREFVYFSPLAWISARNKDGQERFIVFDRVAYICNDAGKTIDTVYGSAF